MRMILALVLCAGALLARAAAQEPVSSQETVSPKESSTASLEGKVVKDPGGEPLKKAIIELIGENQDESGNYTATSDPEGNFKIAGIRAGRYHLFVERAGYLEVDEKHRRSAGLTLSFAAGHDVKDQILRMLPAAIVTGRVVDEDGDPMSDVQVWISRKRSGSKFKLDPAGSAQTDDLGGYRIAGLFPDKYFIVATPMPNFQSLVQTQKNVSDPPDPSADLSYVPTFYPNATSRAAASPIELHAGDEMPVDFSLSRIHTARIRGTIEGLETGVKAVVWLRMKDGRSLANAMFNAAETNKDGRFEFTHVAPGSYEISAITLQSDRPQMLQREIEVGESNMDDLRLIHQPLGTLRGHVHFPQSARLEFSSAMVSLSSLSDEDGYGGNIVVASDGSSGYSGPVRLKPDGSFEMKNVPPGLYEIDLSSDSKALADSYIESIVTNMKDVVDTGINVSGGTLLLDISMASGAGVIEGNVATDKDEAVPNATIVAVPDPKLRKHRDRYFRSSTDQSGHFTLRGLRPGEYKLLAWEVLDGDEYLDPEFVAQFESQAVVAKIEKGTHQNVSLKVIPAANDQP